MLRLIIKQSRRCFSSKYTASLNLPNTSFNVKCTPNDRELPLVTKCCDEIYELQSTWIHRPLFTLHDGPPFANGDVHMGHALNKIIKDIVLRYKVLCGYRVGFVVGWDCHGLPIEIKALDAYNQQLISRHSDTDRCEQALAIRRIARAFATDTLEKQRDDMRRWGIMAEWHRPYLTMDPGYEARQLYIFGQLVANGHVYRGFKPVYWSPSSQTALAEAELEYDSDHLSQSVVVAFALKHVSDALRCVVDASIVNVYALIWTTTPWTIPANQAIAYGADIRYALCFFGEQQSLYIVAENLVDDVRKMCDIDSNDVRVHAVISGNLLAQCVAHHPLFSDKESPMLAADHVDLSTGTGLVHTAPGHGIEDWKLCIQHNIEVICPVDKSGAYTSDVGAELCGLSVLDEGQECVIQLLKTRGLLLSRTPYRHRYPYDWRTKKPVIFRATAQWFMSVATVKNRAVDALENVQVVPSVGRNVLRGMLGTRIEWCISRQRAWGVPLPVFYNKHTGEPLLTRDSIEHVRKIVAKHPQGVDCWWSLPLKDLLPAEFRESADDYERGHDTLDVWFDSGTSWYATLPKRPNETTQCDLVVEGSDQHRGWFQSSLLTSVAAQDRSPYRNIVTHGFVVDHENKKMSKSVGNVISPKDVIDGSLFHQSSSTNAKKRRRGARPSGAELVRLWVASVDFTHDVVLSTVGLEKVAQVLHKWRNTWRFLLGSLSDFDVSQLVPFDRLKLVDQYMLCDLYAMYVDVTKAYDEYNFVRVYTLLVSYHSMLSSFYFEICKDCLYAEHTESDDRRCAQTVFAYIITSLVRMVAPLLPFQGEEIINHMNESLHRVMSDEDPMKTKSDSVSSVFEYQWPKLPSQWENASVARRGLMIRRLREAVNKCIEPARTDKRINTPLQVGVVLQFSETQDGESEVSAVCRELRSELADILTVGDVKLDDDGDVPPEWREYSSRISLGKSDSDEIVIHLKPATGEKCERCWNYRHLTDKVNNLCARCESVMTRVNHQA